MLTPDMKRIIREQRLGFVATASLDGTPNVSPKGTFVVLDDRTIAFGEIRSPNTIRNLKTNPRIEVNLRNHLVGASVAGETVDVVAGEQHAKDESADAHGVDPSRIGSCSVVVGYGCRNRREPMEQAAGRHALFARGAAVMRVSGHRRIPESPERIPP